jgi:hypothetical protein
MRLSNCRINWLIYITLLGMACLVIALSGQQTLAIGSLDSQETERSAVQVINAQDPLQDAVGGTWHTLLRFDKPAKYEYQLTYRGIGLYTVGTLQIEVSSAYIICQYHIGGRRGAAAWRPSASSPGETYMTALLADGLWSADEISLLWTPFMVNRWAHQFAALEWRVGPGWAVRGGSASQFTIDQMLRDVKGATYYRAHLETSEGRPLEIDVDLQLPLPKYIKWTNGAGSTFEAILQ